MVKVDEEEVKENKSLVAVAENFPTLTQRTIL